MPPNSAHYHPSTCPNSSYEWTVWLGIQNYACNSSSSHQLAWAWTLFFVRECSYIMPLFEQAIARHLLSCYASLGIWHPVLGCLKCWNAIEQLCRNANALHCLNMNKFKLPFYVMQMWNYAQHWHDVALHVCICVHVTVVILYWSQEFKVLIISNNRFITAARKDSKSLATSTYSARTRFSTNIESNQHQWVSHNKWVATGQFYSHIRVYFTLVDSFLSHKTLEIVCHSLYYACTPLITSSSFTTSITIPFHYRTLI